ncbi:zinc-finger domain-containing protein [Paenibacillus odorifer]|uniref:zinc-finger domain-containing protein n=1 Tax=Paenibacillus odorifer TaxID=189426 RepID=UPI00096C7A46|nr:zinc-finger domain-containing protein [Paenibacillus odorifer]
MKDEIRKERLRLLSEIDDLEENCNGCMTRKQFNNLKDATGLSHACKACPVGMKLSKYGDKLLNLL